MLSRMLFFGECIALFIDSTVLSTDASRYGLRLRPRLRVRPYARTGAWQLARMPTPGIKSIYLYNDRWVWPPPRHLQTLKHVKNCAAVAGATAGRRLALHRCSTVPGAPEAEHAP